MDGLKGQKKEFVLDVGVQQQLVKVCEEWCHMIRGARKVHECSSCFYVEMWESRRKS